MIKFITVYVVLLTFAELTQLPFVKTIANAFAIVIYANGILTVSRKPISLAFVLYSILLVIAAFVLHGFNGAIEAIKYTSIFVAYYSGLTSNSRDDPYEYLLIAIPAVLIIYDLVMGYYVPEKKVGIFVNRNNAVLYFIVTSLFLMRRYGSQITYIYQYIIVILFNTIGAAIALITSQVVHNVKKLQFKYVGIFILLSLFTLFYRDHIPVVQRATNSITGMYILFSEGISLDHLSKLNYGEAVGITGSTEVSFLFRLKHWLEIAEYVSIQNQFTIFFGQIGYYPPGITTYNVPPHNDYLRIVVSNGIIGLLLFFLFIYTIVDSRKETTVVLLFFLFYMLTENIIDNYPAIIILYYTYGKIKNRSLEEGFSNQQIIFNYR